MLETLRCVASYAKCVKPLFLGPSFPFFSIPFAPPILYPSFRNRRNIWYWPVGTGKAKTSRTKFGKRGEWGSGVVVFCAWCSVGFCGGPLCQSSHFPRSARPYTTPTCSRRLETAEPLGIGRMEEAGGNGENEKGEIGQTRRKKVDLRAECRPFGVPLGSVWFSRVLWYSAVGHCAYLPVFRSPRSHIPFQPRPDASKSPKRMVLVG